MRGREEKMKLEALFMTIPLLLAVVIVIAPISAYADNESSYKYGFQAAKSEWQSCATTDGEGDCTAAHDYCSDPITGTVPVFVRGEHVYEAVNLGHVSNQTACVDGYDYASRPT